MTTIIKILAAILILTVFECCQATPMYLSIGAGYPYIQNIQNRTIGMNSNFGYQYTEEFSFEENATIIFGSQNNQHVGYHIFGGAVKGNVPISDMLAWYAKAGIAIGLSDKTVSDQAAYGFNSGPLLSTGIETTIWKHFAIFTEAILYIPVVGQKNYGNASLIEAGIRIIF